MKRERGRGTDRQRERERDVDFILPRPQLYEWGDKRTRLQLFSRSLLTLGTALTMKNVVSKETHVILRGVAAILRTPETFTQQIVSGFNIKGYIQLSAHCQGGSGLMKYTRIYIVKY